MMHPGFNGMFTMRYGKCNDVTGLQLPGVLDNLYSYEGPLGSTFSTHSVSLYLWAPTVQAVSACIYADPFGGNPLETVLLEEVNGVWTMDGPRSWENCYYVYEVSVYHLNTLKIEKCTANDPYARGLSADGKRTLLVNLDCDNLKPKGWDDLTVEKPDLSSFADISIYELHIRDFSLARHITNNSARTKFCWQGLPPFKPFMGFWSLICTQKDECVVKQRIS